MNIELRWMTSGDAATIEAASYLFDDDVQRDWAERFLRQGNHHLCIAYVDDVQIAVCHGTGGMLSTGATLVLGQDVP